MTRDIHINGLGLVHTRAGPVADILDDASVPDGTTHVTVIASDGYRASIPLVTLKDGGVLSIEDSAWRLTVVEGATLCWNVKGVVGLEPTISRAVDDIPDNPSH